MSTPVCVSCQDVLSCSDSPLSITGNVIGILTFMSAIIISFQVQYNLLRNAERSISDLMDTVDARHDELERLHRRLDKKRDSIKGELLERMEQHMKRALERLKEAHALIVQFTGYQSGRNYGFWSTVLEASRQQKREQKFIAKEGEIRQVLESVGKAIEKLRGLESDVFSETNEDETFQRKVLEELSEMKSEMNTLKEVHGKLLDEVKHLRSRETSSEHKTSVDNAQATAENVDENRSESGLEIDVIGTTEP